MLSTATEKQTWHFISLSTWLDYRPIKSCLFMKRQIFKQESVLCFSLVCIIKILICYWSLCNIFLIINISFIFVFYLGCMRSFFEKHLIAAKLNSGRWRHLLEVINSVLDSNLCRYQMCTFFSKLLDSPPVGHCLLIIEASRSHSDTQHSVTVLWKSDRSVAENSTCQYTTITRDSLTCIRRDSNPQSLQASFIPRGHWYQHKRYKWYSYCSHTNKCTIY
jgi:hypothetical protein